MKNLTKKTVFLIALSMAPIYSGFQLSYKDKLLEEGAEGATILSVIDKIIAPNGKECAQACAEGGGTASNFDGLGCDCKGATKYTLRKQQFRLPADVMTQGIAYFAKDSDFKDHKIIVAKVKNGIKQECIKVCEKNSKKSVDVNGESFTDEYSRLQYDQNDFDNVAISATCYCK